MALTWVYVVVVVGSWKAERMRTDPLAAALAVDVDELCVLAVDARRRTQFLRTERRACVDAVLARAQLTAVRLELITVVVHLAVQTARLARLR